MVPNLVVDLYFLLDIFVNFNTSSYDWEQAKYVLDRSVISREYLGSWFVVDLVSCCAQIKSSTRLQCARI